MNANDPLMTEISELIIKVMDEDATADEFARLQHLLRTDANAREHFFDLISTFAGIDEIQTLCLEQINQDCSALLKTLAQEETQAPTIAIPPKEPELIQRVQREKVTYALSRRSLLMLAVSAAAILLLVVFLRLTPPDRPALVARLTRTVDAQWENAVGVVQTGADLYAGPMRLSKGLAEITFDGGATVVVEAPADFSLTSAQQLFLKRGRLVAKIDNPLQETFVVCCPYASVVDYGTEFGVEVNSTGLQTHVYVGKVALRNSVNPIKFDASIELSAGEGGTATPDQRLQRAVVDERQFVRSDEFDIRLKAAEGSAYHRWLQYSRQIRKRPDLAVYFAFDEDRTQPAGSVKGYAAGSALLNGHFQSFRENGQFPEWVPGRFPGKSALRFRRSELNGIKVPPDPAFCIGGPLTIAAWVYFPDASLMGGHLVICRDMQNVNYQFSYFDETYYEHQHNRFEFNRYGHPDDGAKKEGFSYNSLRQNIQAGQWYHLAVTHDGHTIRLYVNGRAVETKSEVFDAEPVPAPLWIGPCMEDERLTLSNSAARGAFNGILDELIILRGSLSEPEIRQLYGAGKP
jgi:hypothetical protein